MTTGYIDNKDAVLKRLARVEGQVRGLQRMVDSDTYCIDVLTQISAATKALQAVALELLEDHLSHRLVRVQATPYALSPEHFDGAILFWEEVGTYPPNVPMPLGVPAEVDADAVTLTLLEPAVTAS
jgi:CsoR family transcriptional regulator, copper-sensing transcriptional repressor